MDARRWQFPEFTIVFFTLAFPSTNDPQPFQPAKARRHDRGAMLAVVAIVIHYHPVVRCAPFVGMGGIGKQRRNSRHLIEPAGDVIIERNWHLFR